MKFSTVVKHILERLLVKEFRGSADRQKSYSRNRLENQLYRQVAIHSYIHGKYIRSSSHRSFETRNSVKGAAEKDVKGRTQCPSL